MSSIIIGYDEPAHLPDPQIARNLQLLLVAQLRKLNGGNPFSKATIEVIELDLLDSEIEGLDANPEDVFIIILSNNPDSRLLAEIPCVFRRRVALVYTRPKPEFDTDPSEIGYTNVWRYDSGPKLVPKLVLQVIYCITGTSNAHVIVDKEVHHGR